MKINGLISFAALLCSGAALFAQGTVITYQGHIADGTGSVNGQYDVKFSLYRTNISGTSLGDVTNTVAASNGLFTTLLDLGGVPDGNPLWLELAVRTNGGPSFTVLAPRQAVLPTPYALFANTASNLVGTVAAAQLTGSLPSGALAGSYSNTVSFTSSNGLFTGTFIGNGSNVNNVDLRTTWSDGAMTWSTNYPGSFTNAPSITNNLLYPTQVATADMNGDGKLDIVTVNSGGNTVAVFTNDGRGSFPLRTYIYPGDLTPSALAIADVNNDGSPDVLAGCWGLFTVAVLTNNGSGQLGLLTNLPVIGRPNSVVPIDLNGDGKMDFVTVSYNANIVGLFTNSGAGRFVVQTNITVGANPLTAVVADFNGDGRLDLVTDNVANNTFTVLTNNGSIFLLATNMNVQPGLAGWVTAMDVNGDGSPDLVADGGFHNLRIFTNTGNAAFALKQSIDLGAGANATPQCVTTGDFNGDGRLDLVTANWAANSVSVLTNDGRGSFALSAVVPAGSNAQHVAVGDLNGDGHLDIVSANNAGSTLSILLNAPVDTAAFRGNGAELTSLNASSLTSGTLADSRLSTNVSLLGAASQVFTGTNVLTNSANQFAGSFSGNGSGLNNVNAALLAGLAPAAFWQLNGNSIAAGQFLGSTNNQPLEFRANNLRALRLEPNVSGAPNVVAGSPLNFVVPGVVGAAIGGGGATNYAGSPVSNRVAASFSTVAGGLQNRIEAGSDFAVIGGGQGHAIDSSPLSTITGGQGNAISNAPFSSIAGGSFNAVAANSTNAAIGGGFSNRVTGSFGTVPGGDSNVAADNAFAAGHRAKALHGGSFVWADSQGADFATTTKDQFIVRATGNVGINTNNPSAPLQVRGAIAADALRAPGAGVGSSTFAFIHRAVSTNTSANVTTIYNSLADGDPNAILIVTHNYNADTNSTSFYNTNLVGVWYNGFHWTIYNENSGVNMPLGRAFNVLVIKP